jgi:carbamoylphosphate synthase large subunit
MTLVFYGNHSSEWMNVLNNDLSISLNPRINIIYNHRAFTSKLKTFKYVIPLMEKHMIELHNGGVKAMMPDIDTIRTFMCKRKFFDYVVKFNLLDNIPKTFKSPNDIRDNKMVIVKPYNFNSGVGMRITDTVFDFEFKYQIVQEYVHGNTEYCAYIVAKDGKIQLCFVYEFVSNNDVYIRKAVNENVISNKVSMDQKYIDTLELFLLPCKYNGICNIDFKIDSDVVKVMEINPRLGGSLMDKNNRQDLIDIVSAAIDVFV